MQNLVQLVRLVWLAAAACLTVSLVYFINGLTVPSGKALVRPLSPAAEALGPQTHIESVTLSHFGFSRWEATVTRIEIWGFWGLLAIFLALVALQATRFGSRTRLWMFQPSPFLWSAVVVMALLTVTPGLFRTIAGATVINASGAEGLYEPLSGFDGGWLIAAGLLIIGWRGLRPQRVALPQVHTTAH